MKKIRLRMNVIDLLFILLIAVICLYVFLNYKTSLSVSENYKELDIIIESGPIKIKLAEKAMPRLSLYDATTGERLGSITETSIVDLAPADGRNGSEPADDMCILRLTVRCGVNDKNGYYLKDGRRILVGDSGEFLMSTLYFHGYIKEFCERSEAPQQNPLTNGAENGGSK